ncbi:MULTISPECIES: hypothetical protein [Phyllobacteriaceae]|uniref:hypothetical protein n=1 Tax=Phyllobacteriaceae TaxID=69277 RepID=UPI0019281612|nr:MULTISPECIES: hypothetical protein [Phyllobacteriaceae]
MKKQNLDRPMQKSAAAQAPLPKRRLPGDSATLTYLSPRFNTAPSGRLFLRQRKC